MTIEEISRLSGVLAKQAGITNQGEVDNAIDYWKPNLLKIDAVKANEAIKSIMMEDTIKAKDLGNPNKWLSQIVRYCGGELKYKPQSSPPPQGTCDRCRNSGLIEVPSNRESCWGYDEHGNKVWNGKYVMTVACECGLGQMAACRMMSIRQYETLFPFWQQEYPVRRLVYQRDLFQSRLETIHDKDDKKKTKAKIAALNAALGEV